MRLITHNMLASPVKGVAKTFPLGIELSQIEVKEHAFNAEFVKHMIPKLDWGALLDACKTVATQCEAMPTDLPPAVTDELIDDDTFLRKLHTAILEIYVIEGSLICPSTGRKFPITNGIPNMLCSADASAGKS